MNAGALRERVAGYADAASQLELLGSLTAIYEREGVLRDGYALALVDHCPDTAKCWDGCKGRASRKASIAAGPGDDGSIFFPWIGARYRPGGVCAVGWNINHSGEEWFTLLEEFVIAEHDRGRLGAGHVQNEWRSQFAYRSLASSIAVADSLAGETAQETPSPQRLAGEMERIARVQAVKCSPLGDRSNPSDEMNARCPSRYLVAELDVLRPRALVVFGDKALDPVVDAIEELPGATGFDWTRKYRGGYGRGTTVATWGEPLTVFALWHPTYARWPTAQAALVADLTAAPLTASA